MVLASITVSRPTDAHWLAHEAGRFFPAQWARFRAGIPESERDGDLIAAYNRLLNEQPDPAVREQAARDWTAWEDALLSLDEGYAVPNPRWEEPGHRLAFARLVTHYFHHAGFLEPDELLRNAGRLAGIPGVLIHGRFDIQGPPDVAWLLAQAWPEAELHFVDAGHTGGDEMRSLIIEATDRFAVRPA